MNLQTISVSNYRSITTAKKIRLDRTTVLIGPNNEGKSNILRALVLAMTALTRGRVVSGSGRFRRVGYNVQGYKWEMDFPINKQAKQPKGETEIILEFKLEDAEYAEFQKEVKSKITGLLPLKLQIGKAGVTVTFHKKGRGAATLSKKSSKIAEFVSNRIEFEHIPAVRTAESAQDIVYELVSRSLEALEQDPVYIEALNTVASLQNPILDSLSDNIHNTLHQFLPQVKKVEIKMPEELRFRAFRRGVTVSVDDGTLTPLEYKGDGVQSLAALAMIRHASTHAGKGKSFVIAIEEPESHLHPKAIHELKEVIDDLGKQHQVIITSHNPLFVDRRVLTSNIIVNNKKAQAATNVEEIRNILGVRASDNLRNAEMVLVVEGEDDVSSIRAILGARSTYLTKCFDNGSLALDSLGGGTNLRYKLSLLRDSICLYHVFLDYDKCGQESYDAAKRAGLLEDGQINFARASGRTESELEDLVDVGVYKGAIEAKYRISLDNPRFKGRKKWSDRIKDVFVAHGKPWSNETKNDVKNLVAEQISADPSNAISAINDTVVDGLTSALEGRLQEKEKAQQDASCSA
ncbi:ATP-dependent nuclease [Rubinisphaera margarita]|uniref:ATP-dependent nuclease n=1 Tax=Rubinisphaera margarita TaxID=2909586 RepID=UPI001EE974D9|nr:ATP-binding protein [Rubinisphaera margarita]MCG6157079.1 AAA family ATPase [Rubinisphaera margarita]